MSFKKRLILLFIVLYLIIQSAILSFVYFQFADFRRQEFYNRLEDKAITTARLLLEVKKADQDLLKLFDRNSIHRMYDEKVLIFDEVNQLIYSSLDDERIEYSTDFLNEVREGRHHYYVDDDGDEVVAVDYQEEDKSYVILASAYDIFGRSTLKNLGTTLVFSSLLGLISIAAAAYFYIRQVFEPISSLSQSIRSIDSANLDHFVNENSSLKELNDLAANYNTMLRRLKSSFESQKSFSRNVSHEMKTPLALIKSRADHLLASAITGEQREDAIQIKQTTSQMGQLLESLLLLQRLESDFPFPQSKHRVDDLLEECLLSLSIRFPSLKVTVDVDSSVTNDAQLTVFVNALLFKVALNNLLENVALHSEAPESAISLVYAGELRVSISNPGSSPLDESLIFQPFYRGEETRQVPGSGLGLSLVRQIVRICGGEVTYLHRGTHHQFCLSLPTAEVNP